MIRPLFVILALSVWQVQAASVREFTLDNGLRVLVQEDHRAPVLVVQVWYRVGSGLERPGLTGISHALEHMMFKGTPEVPSGEFARIVADNGGKENAFTSRDYTVYFQHLAADRLAVAFELEADRMRNLHFAPFEIERELKVIREERLLRTQDKPQNLVYERLLATAFFNSSYGAPVIGWMEDIEGLDVARLRAWYDRWYGPNNAVIVVVGDVEPEAVRVLAERYFGGVKPVALEAVPERREPQQRGPRRVVVRAPARVPYLIMGFKVPSLASLEDPADAYALEVLAWILDGGKSARLTRNLVRGTRLASSCGAEYHLYWRLPNLFILDATPSKGQAVATVEQALMAEIARLKREPVRAEELQRVKTQMVADRVFKQDSVYAQAKQIGRLEAVGLGWRVREDYKPRILGVNAEDLQRVARRYLTTQRQTVAVLEPQPLAKRPARVRPHRGGRHVQK